MKKAIKTKIFILIIIAALLFIGRSYFKSEPTQAKKIRNVLLISMDTTRPDFISCYGYNKGITPNIDALAAEGILFERTYSPIPYTLPSHSSMLTGTIPPYHGIHDNSGYKLSESNVTLAEILKDNGFVTGAIVGSVILDSKFGLDQGFDLYDDNFQNERSPMHIVERQAEETQRIANQWLEKNQNENMFLFLHFYDPHLTYQAPEPYFDMFMPDDADPNDLGYLISRYCGEIAYTDNCIKGILDKLKDLGLYDSTLIIITGDHGEMFHDHKEVTHGYFIYEGNVGVPLIIKVPGVSTTRRIKNTVGLIDIVPTVCSLLGIDEPLTLQGVDISPYLLEDEPEDLKRHIFMESLLPTKYKANSLLGIVNDEYKYIQTTRPELYDMITDQAESIDLVEAYDKVAHLLKGRLENILDDTLRSKNKDSKMELDAESLKQLEALGYVGGDVTEEFTFDTSKKDPKDLIKYHLINTRIRAVMNSENFEDAREMCEKMISMQPDVHIPYSHLAAIANKLGDYDEAVKQLTKVLEIEPENVKTHNLLADIYLTQEKYELAIKQVNKSIEINPEQFGAYRQMSKVYLQQKNYEQSLHYAQKALSINPKEFYAINTLGALYNRQNKPEKAIESFKKSLAIYPKQPDVMNELGVVLYGQGKTQEALTLWQDTLAIDPNQFYAANSLGLIKATSKDKNIYDPPGALKYARQACKLTEYKHPGILDTLAAALAANGQFDKAAETAAKAIEIAKAAGQTEQAQSIQQHLDLYKKRKARRE
jgi:arylsulfatase A-like enzyme/Tfp pilus assembly protein PilF